MEIHLSHAVIPIGLVVDDDSTLRKTVADALRRNNFEIFEAENGEDAIDILEKKSGKIKFVVSDFNMPRIDGRRLLKYVRSHTPSSTVFIIMSGSVNESLTRELIALGADAILCKPFSASTLIHELKLAQERNSTHQAHARIQDG